ncbi:MAG: thioesterase [Phaeodactylibacter sp.]|nr:thioesterase [Phaeodactylibacter sp.]
MDGWDTMETTHPKTILICLPYAGAGANCFTPLRSHLPEGLQMVEATLPGRGQRYAEPLLKNADDMAADIWKQVSPLLYRPYALLGHSMGGLLAYLLCHKISQAGLPPPVHLFLSGREAPSVPPKEPLEYLLPYQAFKEQLEGYGGIAPEIVQDEDTFAFFEPMIRADFEAVGTWQYHPRPKLDIPVTVLWGTEEDLTEQEARAWQQEFSAEARFEVFEGGHFFIFEQAKAFCSNLKMRIGEKRPLQQRDKYL